MVRAVLAALLLTASPLLAAVTTTHRGQGANGASAAPTHVFSGAVSSGDVGFLLIQNRTDETTTITSVTDTSSNTWTAVAGSPVDHAGGTTQRTWLYVCQNMAAGTPTVTINFSGSISSTYAAQIFTGAANSGQPDTNDNPADQGSSTALAAGSINPASTGMVLVASVTTGGVTSSGTTAGYTQQTTAAASRVHLWTKASTSGVAEAMTSTWNASTGWIVFNVNIAPSGGGGGTGAPPSARLLRVGD